MRNQHKVIAGIGTLAAAASIVAAAPAASASGTQNYCPTDRVCLWFNSGYSGARADFRVSDANLSNELFNDGPVGASGWLVQVEDNAASFHNRSGNTVIFFNFRNCDVDGAYRVVADGAKDNFGDALKNKVSSFIISNEGVCTNVDQSNA
ncbi:peptidase inhibitor family I36 protein [Phycicoccus jejuensis]|uniref:peptidase inhibitor family I36 protein n=1 Tax=Phycicoccus jejuensis TaxID=367299 RepID=UPI0004C4423A|nr:peptidase inhibitor family I36 protein [Phycicoccus jejuensis]